MWGYIVGFSVLMLALATIFARNVIRRLDSIESSPVPDRREEKLFKLYTEIESMLDSFEDYVGEMHDELEGKREELAELSRRVSSLYTQIEYRFVQFSECNHAQTTGAKPIEQAAAAKEPEEGNGYKSRLSSQDRSVLRAIKTKSARVRFMMNRGLSPEEAARELGIGKGEVRLIANLDR